MSELRHEGREPPVAALQHVDIIGGGEMARVRPWPIHAVAEVACIWPIESIRLRVANFGDMD